MYRDASMLSWEDKKFLGISSIIGKLKEIPQAVRANRAYTNYHTV